MSIAQINYKLQEQIKKFSGKLYGDLNKTAGRFIAQMIYGILKRKSVHLSEIARSLGENIPEIKTVNRLSRQLGRKDLHPNINRAIIEEGSGKINSDSLLILDLSDIRKNYAKKMEYLTKVHDGSTGEISNGYVLLKIIAYNKNCSEIVPLYSELYSSKEPGFKSENNKIFDAIDLIRSSINTTGTWVIDRGGDRMNIFMYLIKHKHDFIIRLIGNRKLIYDNREILAEDLLEHAPVCYRESIERTGKGEDKFIPLTYRYLKVNLPNVKKNLYLLIVEGFGEKPMMLLTTIKLKKNFNILKTILESYICRWKIEETIRFVKQSYNLEDIRLLRYKRLKNMMAIVLAVTYFVAVHLGNNSRLEILTRYAIDAAKILFGIPDFKYYTIVNGIHEILSKFIKGISFKSPKYYDNYQLLLL